MNKCTGCGVELQNISDKELGYTINLDNSLCERCFRIKNYNDYKVVTKSNEDYIKILKEINKTDSLVILLVDLFDIPKALEDINKYINNKILLVLTKRDILPVSVYDENIINYFKRYKLNIVETLIISSLKNYNFDLLKNMINYYKTNNEVYIVGFTNAGKSTMINKYLYNYTDKNVSITTSPLRSTTIDSIRIDVDDNLTFIDTPGLLDEGNFLDYIDSSDIKKIVPTSEIKPKTYQVHDKQSIFIDELFRIDCENENSLTFYVSNKLKFNRVYKDCDKLKEYKKRIISVDDNQDIVINGLGFIKVVHKDVFTIYVNDDVNVYVRDALI